KVFKGRVTLVGDQALLRSTGIATSQSTTGTEEAKDFKVVVTLEDPTKELRPGLSCTAKITTAHKNSVLSLPMQALTMHDPALDVPKSKGGVEAATVSSSSPVKSNPVQGAFVVEKDPRGRLRAKFVPVKTGITGATDIEVLSGLTPGEEVVTGPYKTLRDLKNGALLKRDKASLIISAAGGSR
ncbi:MAG: secretion protein HlyD, partial [Acidobacteriota bacterium]|nr:secretion protein HlyD [Acidobacteriota bacterium]